MPSLKRCRGDARKSYQRHGIKTAYVAAWRMARRGNNRLIFDGHQSDIASALSSCGGAIHSYHGNKIENNFATKSIVPCIMPERII